MVHDGVCFVPAEVGAAAFVECARGFEVEDAAAAAAAVAAAEPAFGPCQLQPVPTAPPRPARAGGPRGYAICQARLRLTDQRRRAWSAGAGHHVSVRGRPSRSRHHRCNRAHLLHSYTDPDRLLGADLLLGAGIHTSSFSSGCVQLLQRQCALAPCPKPAPGGRSRGKQAQRDMPLALRCPSHSMTSSLGGDVCPTIYSRGFWLPDNGRRYVSTDSEHS